MFVNMHLLNVFIVFLYYFIFFKFSQVVLSGKAVHKLPSGSSVSGDNKIDINSQRKLFLVA